MSGTVPLWLKESILKEPIIVVDNPQSNTNFSVSSTEISVVLFSVFFLCVYSCHNNNQAISSPAALFLSVEWFLPLTEKYHNCADISMCGLLNSRTPEIKAVIR